LTKNLSQKAFSPLNPTQKKHKKVAAWMHEHVNDHYVKQAQEAGYRSRAAFKLLEIDARDQLFARANLVVDLGAAPGSWTQVAQRQTQGKAVIIASDILPMQGINQVHFVQGDFTEPEPLAAIEQLLAGRKADLVLSDMAPNMSGIPNVDMARLIYLAELAADFAQQYGTPGVRFLVKLFQGTGYPEYVAHLRQIFQQVDTRKPKASRDRSAEVYLLCTGLKQA
jgi:23S rRNA (uridine2552-2'-O)-methyltransferase